MPLTLATLFLPTSPGAFRLFLALLVFGHHLSSFGFGKFAVYVFFALSGFWLNTMWRDRYSHARTPYRTYLVSRVWRLAPVMIVTSIITIPLLVLIGIEREVVFSSDPLHLAVSTVFLLSYSYLTYVPVAPAWSLDIEMQFYLLAPLLAVALLRPALRLPLIAGAAILALVATWSLSVPTLAHYAIFFLAGMTVSATRWQPGSTLAYGSAAAVVGTLVLVTVTPLAGILWGGANPSPLYAWNPLFNVVMAFVCLPYAMWTVYQKSDRADRMLADLSYVIYLLHWVAVQWFYSMAGQPVLERLMVAGTGVVAVCLGSLALWHLVDRPANRLRHAWVSSRMPAAGDEGSSGVLAASA
ncbi:hypothetical protein PK98_06690 [Croceibacterium mercuriale]|uniref:Acyltransferase 3 domain-containing protein n=2 Tax=Croceibacterium mercuriale TaxID=1572751 RepID=A0A0B2C1Y5_9SPHN|nr:hypothetical protein PK98_06690 [Croceibacterium mercuriale]